MKLEGKVAIVAGGGQGIGEGIVKCLAEEGADVVIVDYDGENAKQVAEEVKSMGRKGLGIYADCADGDLVAKAVQEIMDTFGKMDILVNNVGGHSAQPPRIEIPTFVDRTEKEWQGYYEQNLKSHIMMSRAVIPHFKEQKSGKIVNISSVSGRFPDYDKAPYTVFKTSVISLTWVLARELAEFNINVNCVCPGTVFTPLWRRGVVSILGRLRQAKAEGTELPGRYNQFLELENLDSITPEEFWPIMMPVHQTPEDMGKTVAFFVSEDSKNITGQTICVDNGMIMR